jgi:nicotinate-nucleotide pyrophosphorylase (carboxylating)
MALPQRVKIAEQIIHRLQWDELDRGPIRRLVELAHDESQRFGPGSHNESSVHHCTVEFDAAGELVFCGAALLPLVAGAYGIKGDLRVRVADGAAVSAGSVIAVLTGPAAGLRTASLMAHAFVSRLSGIASFARRHVDELGSGRTRLLDNSATTPGWNTLERFALACGGAWSGGDGATRIRIEVDSRVPFRLESEIRRAREASPDVPVELIVRQPADVEFAVAASPDLIRLERFEVAALRDAVVRAGGRVFVEAHGGITLANLAEHAGLGLDFVSVDGLVSDAVHAPIDRTWRD